VEQKFNFKNSFMKKAVLLLIFNRSETTQKVFEAIRIAKPPRLYVASDGARLGKEGEADEVEKARDIVLKNIDWQCEVKTLLRERNLGCRKAVSDAITWFFENEEDGIILEDDCLPSQSFFYFCEELLDYHRNNKSVMHISGDQFVADYDNGSSYYFAKIMHCWGWASWADRWKYYGDDLSNFNDKDIEKFSNDKNVQNYWLDILKKMQNKEIDSWAYQWLFKIIEQGGICINPIKNLISNIGFGISSTHTRNKDDPSANLNACEITEIVHPVELVVDEFAVDYIYKNVLGILMTHSIIAKKMNWKYYNQKFEYEEKFNDLAWPWVGHRYFAYDLVANLKPKRIVELGTHYGTSLWSFSQAAKDQNIGVEINAVDTWQGEKHAGFYGEEVFETVNQIKDKYYPNQKINLFRKTFDEALDEFEDNSIDILHIDGLHTYEAVKHDFEAWFPRIKNGGVVLFHDIVVNRDDFGVYKLWRELKGEYQTMEFRHSYGLGVLFKKEVSDVFKFSDDLELHYSYFLDDIENGKISKLQQENSDYEDIIEQEKKIITQKEQEIIILNQTVQQKEQEINLIRSSRFWKIRTLYLKFKFLIFSPKKFVKKYLKI